ncbi:MAG: 3-oxoacyl-[acyl-carrier-protein] reductase [Planctomycetota bacterium]|jgi:3-oxoacyl-[acyl-carrier protein] reductase
MNLDFNGKRALVTGGARGIGQAIGAAFCERGASVALADVLGEVEDAATALGDRAKGHHLDVTDPAAVKEVVSRVTEDLGGIDILVNNAGITRDALLPRMSAEDFELVLKVNLHGTFYMTQAVARGMMKARSGAVVNVASVIGLHGNVGQANYAASKGGVIALTKSTAKDLAGRGIRVNAVAPGFIETAMTETLPEKVKDQMLGVIPFGRFGETSDVVGAVLYLSSDLAAYVTGQVLVVDGGMFI